MALDENRARRTRDQAGYSCDLCPMYVIVCTCVGGSFWNPCTSVLSSHRSGDSSRVSGYRVWLSLSGTIPLGNGITSLPASRVTRDRSRAVSRDPGATEHFLGTRQCPEHFTSTDTLNLTTTEKGAVPPPHMETEHSEPSEKKGHLTAGSTAGRCVSARIRMYTCGAEPMLRRAPLHCLLARGHHPPSLLSSLSLSFLAYKMEC